MTCIPMRLECAGLETLALDTGEIGAASLDLGDAETRAVTVNAPDADGAIDSTALIGARVVTLAVLLDTSTSTSTRFGLAARLRAFTGPTLRPLLYFQPSPADPELMVTLRRGPFADPWTPTNQTRAKVTVQWVAPLGIIESAALRTATVFAIAAGAETGRPYDLTFDRTYPTSAVLGTSPVVNAGNQAAYPVLRIYGPCSDPIVQNMTLGRSLVFTGLTIGANEFLEVNTRTKTIRYNGLATDSRYNTLAFPQSMWWALAPGTNIVRFTPGSFAAPSQVQIDYRDAYL